MTENPSCLQTTWASVASHRSSHTVPQILLLQISTRPWVLLPPWSLTAPWIHWAVSRKVKYTSSTLQRSKSHYMKALKCKPAIFITHCCACAEDSRYSDRFMCVCVGLSRSSTQKQPAKLISTCIKQQFGRFSIASLTWEKTMQVHSRQATS